MLANSEVEKSEVGFSKFSFFITHVPSTELLSEEARVAGFSQGALG